MANFELPITREEALKLIEKYNSDKSDINHYLESEAIMRELAKHLGKSEEEQEYWGMLGLLHDVDWGVTKDQVETHLTKAPEILKEVGFDKKFIDIILSHGYGFTELPHLADKKRTEEIQHALAASETLTGLIHAYALMRPTNLEGMKAKKLKKKFKDSTFAAKVDRDVIREIEKLGIQLGEFFDVSIQGIRKIAKEVDLE